tara:strand:- start:215 stop:472 length:258 start_codon:yes stop_codon:yes gene_type:complete
MIDMNGGRGSKTSFNIKLWLLNLSAITSVRPLSKMKMNYLVNCVENNDNNIGRAEVVGSNRQKGEKGYLPWQLVLASSCCDIHQQ